MGQTIGRRQLFGATAATGLVGALGFLDAGSARAAVRPTVRLGSRGPVVVQLQRRLGVVGYWCGAADGIFGAQTQQAVFALQKVWGLVRDGIVGPLTWAATTSDVRPAPRYGFGYRVEVDKARQLLLVVWGPTARFVLNTSTGANRPFYAWGRWYDGRTPSGRFAVRSHADGWVIDALGALYRPYFFDGAIAVHGDTSVPPYNVSHGCVRVSVVAQDHLIATGVLVDGRRVDVY